MDRALLKLLSTWDDALEPSAPLDLGDELGRQRYVPVDRWPDGAGRIHRLRGEEDVVEQLRNQILLASLKANASSTQLLAGFRGTGKTTELQRLAAQLAGPEHAVVTFDAQEYLALNSAPTAELIGLTLAAGLAENVPAHLQAAALEGRGIWERMRDFLTQDVGDMEVSLPAAGADIKLVLRETLDFADQLRRLLVNKPNRLQEFVHDVVQRTADKLAPRQLVLLVDGLDKFVVPREHVPGVYRAMADVFFQHINLLRLPGCHVVYVIPPYLGFLNKGLAEAYGGRLRVLPSIKVRERFSKGGSVNAAAVQCLEQVAGNRIDLDRLFGAGRQQAVETLALACGGHVRDLFNLLREVLRRAMSGGLPVKLADVQSAIDALSRDRGGLFRPTLELLAAVRDSENLAALDEAQLGALSAAMDEYLVLSYRNGDAWYGVHPLIEPLLEEGLAALARLDAAQGRSP